jgi:prevent-host-death family protein
MGEVSIRELRDDGGDSVDRVARGERITITRAGKPVAELRPASDPPLGVEALLARWRTVPTVDAAVLRVEIDEALDMRS